MSLNDEKKENMDPYGLANTTPYGQGEVEAIAPNSKGTHRSISSRQSVMMAIGGIIGTGLFVGSGQALARVGPGFLLFAYVVLGSFVYVMITATTTVASYLPMQGASMAAYGTRYVSRSLGFAMTWLYWYSFSISISYEITAATVLIDYWPNPVPTGVWLTILFLVVLSLNLLPVKYYAEAEFWFASTKVLLISGLLVLSVVLLFGGGPSHERLGFRYWESPGAWFPYLVGGASGRVCAFIYALTFSTFSFAFGPELVVLTAGEMKAPRHTLPRVSNTFIWRLAFFYILGALGIGIICSPTAPGLVSGAGNAAASPWVIGIQDSGIRGLDSVVNAGVLLSAWSAGNAYLYMASRTLYGSALNGNAPKIFSRCTKSGIPIYAVLGSAAIGLLSYLNLSSSASVVFNWFLSITNSGGFISWICCCIIFIRFMQAVEVQNIKDLPYQSILQPYAAWASLVFFTLLLLLNGFSVFFPGHWDTPTFITSYIGIPIFLGLFLTHKFIHYNEPWVISSDQVDMHTGLAELKVMEEEARLERLEKREKSGPSIKKRVKNRIYLVVCKRSG
ncbi:amino acid permease/ SLC12A domain-containing protein [Xylaria arbuscula]|nr:amino acid permease/ SLC12A domain-containing protein [Xylaria arbuscula]